MAAAFPGSDQRTSAQQDEAPTSDERSKAAVRAFAVRWARLVGMPYCSANIATPQDFELLVEFVAEFALQHLVLPGARYLFPVTGTLSPFSASGTTLGDAIDDGSWS